MSADLTCRCQHDEFVSHDFYGRCMDCRGTGRRDPTLDEWDALKAELADAEADAQAWCNEAFRYREALLEIANHSGMAAGAMARCARTALEGLARELLSERTRRIRADE